MDLIEKYLGEGKQYKIYRTSVSPKNLIGNLELSTIKKIHGKDIEKIDDKKGIVIVSSKVKTLDDIKEAKGSSTRMECIECGHKFKKKIGKHTTEIKCPKCGGYDTEVA